MHISRAVPAGVIATASMTALLLIEPAIGLPEIAIGQLLSTSLSITTAHLAIGPATGWLVHFLVGIAWALLYVYVVMPRLPGAPFVRGLAYGFLVFLLAQSLLLPLVGGGFFSGGNPSMLTGSLLGHLVYGGVLGWVYGETTTTRAAAAPMPA
jgi:uncharacterized membrane protein YagU involved in acid resistance